MKIFLISYWTILRKVFFLLQLSFAGFRQFKYDYLCQVLVVNKVEVKSRINCQFSSLDITLFFNSHKS